MKTSIKYIKSSIISISTMILLLGMSVSQAASVLTVDNSGINTDIIYAGQHIVVGAVTTEIVETDLVVTYTTTDGWELIETQLWVGTDLAEMPQNRKGSPKIGHFPYKSTFFAATTHSVSIPLDALGFACPSDASDYIIAAHASVQLVNDEGVITQTETGWSEGSLFVEKGMWGTYSNITLVCEDVLTDDEKTSVCETAFAYSGGTNIVDGDITHSFLDITEEDAKLNRWGWSNGTISEGVYSWDIYAGAGQSDISKGVLVGTLVVDYNGSTAQVTYHIDAPYYMEENHLYVGNDILPRDKNEQYTVAPGMYPSIHDLDNTSIDTHIVYDVSGDLHVVAHATVCGFSE